MTYESKARMVKGTVRCFPSDCDVRRVRFSPLGLKESEPIENLFLGFNGKRVEISIKLLEGNDTLDVPE